MISHEKFSIFLVQKHILFSLLSFVIGTAEHKGQDQDQTCGCKQYVLHHDDVLLFRISKRAIIVENAKNESMGIDTIQNSSMYFSVHETPCEQGCKFAGMTPAYSRV
jgi:hypothetical protein